MNSESGKVEINGNFIWYEKFGSGSKILLLIPGAIGTARTDFYPQLFGENAFDLQKLTIIAVELPGWGRSRPPERLHAGKVFRNDAQCCVQLMECLGYNRFSVLGWSEGAKVALIIAANHSECVDELIIQGIVIAHSQSSIKNMIATKNVGNWNSDLVDSYLKVYKDENEIQSLWRRHVIWISNSPNYYPKGICNNRYDSIKCRTLVIHGNKDPLVEMDQPLQVLNNVDGAELKSFPLGSHNLHHIYQSEYKNTIEEFLLNN